MQYEQLQLRSKIKDTVYVDERFTTTHHISTGGCCYKGSHWAKGSYWISWSHHFESFTITSMTLLNITNGCVINHHKYAPLVVSPSRSFPQSWLKTRCKHSVSQQMSLGEQILLTLRSTQVLRLFLVGSYLPILIVLYSVVCVIVSPFCYLFFGNCVVCLSI